MDFIYEVGMQCSLESALADLSNLSSALEADNASSNVDKKKSIIKRIFDGIMKILRAISEKFSRLVYRFKKSFNISGTKDAANNGDEAISTIARCINELNSMVKFIGFDIGKMASFYKSKSSMGMAFFEDDDKNAERMEEVAAVIDKLEKLREKIGSSKIIIDYRAEPSLKQAINFIESFNDLNRSTMEKCKAFMDAVNSASDINPEIVRRVNMYGNYVSKISHAANMCNAIIGQIQGMGFN